jgi:hypothetical protein
MRKSTQHLILSVSLSSLFLSPLLPLSLPLIPLIPLSSTVASIRMSNLGAEECVPHRLSHDGNGWEEECDHAEILIHQSQHHQHRKKHHPLPAQRKSKREREGEKDRKKDDEDKDDEDEEEEDEKEAVCGET